MAYNGVIGLHISYPVTHVIDICWSNLWLNSISSHWSVHSFQSTERRDLYWAHISGAILKNSAT